MHSYKIHITGHFQSQIKPLLRKDPGLAKRAKTSLQEFSTNQAIAIGQGLYKIRIKGQNKGKSGGYRAYIFLLEQAGFLTPITIYSKSDQSSISEKELLGHLRAVKIELELL